MRRRTPHFRSDGLTPLEAAGERALRVKKLTKRDDAVRASACADFEAAKAALGERFDAYARCMESLAGKHLRGRRSRLFPVRDVPTVESVFGSRK